MKRLRVPRGQPGHLLNAAACYYCATVSGVHKPFITILAALAVLAGCSDDPAPSTSGALNCDPSAVPVLLASKSDDDDGDGIILDADFPTIDDEDDDIADHAWIRDHSGQYHLFFHNEGRGAPWVIEHYTTRTLDRLDYAGTVLHAQAGAWDAGGAWAPHVIEVEGTSGDGCLYECNQAWTTWGDAGDPFNQQCRDAFVMRDDEHDRWLMFATARSTNGYGVVTIAHSQDLIAWTGAGFIDATRRLASGTGAQTTGGQAENPFVMSHDDTHYLLFTDWQDPEDSLGVATPRTIVQYATSTSLDVDAAGSASWVYRGYTPDPGVNAIEVFDYGFGISIMSQSLSSRHSGYVRPIRRMLRLQCIEWGPGVSFETTNVGFEDADAAGLLAPEMQKGGRTFARPPSQKH